MTYFCRSHINLECPERTHIARSIPFIQATALHEHIFSRFPDPLSEYRPITVAQLGRSQINRDIVELTPQTRRGCNGGGTDVLPSQLCFNGIRILSLVFCRIRFLSCQPLLRSRGPIHYPTHYPPRKADPRSKLFLFSFFSTLSAGQRWKPTNRASCAHDAHHHRPPLRRFFPLHARDRSEIVPRSAGDRDHGIHMIFSLLWMKEHA